MQLIIQSVFIGIFATIAIDIYALILKHGLKQTTTDWGMVGRWFAYMPDGQLVHRPISQSSAVKNEKLIGWSAHYIIGITYGWVYLMFVDKVLETSPTPGSALVFGLVTVLAPWLIMQPGLGMGLFARRVPNPWIKRITSLSVHALFGVALFAGWYLITL